MCNTQHVVNRSLRKNWTCGIMYDYKVIIRKIIPQAEKSITCRIVSGLSPLYNSCNFGNLILFQNLFQM